MDASVKYRRWRESRGKDKEYEVVIRWVECIASSAYMCWVRRWIAGCSACMEGGGGGV